MIFISRVLSVPVHPENLPVPYPGAPRLFSPTPIHGLNWRVQDAGVAPKGTFLLENMKIRGLETSVPVSSLHGNLFQRTPRHNLLSKDKCDE